MRRAHSVVLGLVFAALVAVSFERWGHPRTDLGGALDRAARVAAGDVLYRDVQSPYGPLPDWIVAAGFRLFGTHLTVAWTIGLVLVVVESLLLLRIARRFGSPAQCLVGLVGFWVLFAFSPGLFGWVLPNTFASTFGVAAATLALALAIEARERGTSGRFVAASLAAGVAGLCKPDYGFAAATTVLLAALLVPGRRLRLAAAAVVPGLALALVTLGTLLLVVPPEVLLFDNLYRVRSLAATVAALRAGVPDWTAVVPSALWRCGIETPLRTAMAAWGLGIAATTERRALGVAIATAAIALPLLPGYPGQLDFTLLAASRGWAWTPAAWLIVVLFAVRGATRGETAASALVLAGVWSIALALRWDLRLMWASYYGVLAPFLLLVVAARLAALLVSYPTALASACVVAVPIVLQATLNARHFVAEYRHVVSYPRGTLRMPMGGQQLAAVVDYVRAHTVPGDWVAVFPEERLINFLAERRHPTRDAGTGPGWLATKADEAACIAELEARRPALIVVSDRRWPEFGAGDLASYNPTLYRWIEREYVAALTTAPGIVRYTVYVPRGSGQRLSAATR